MLKVRSLSFIIVPMLLILFSTAASGQQPVPTPILPPTVAESSAVGAKPINQTAPGSATSASSANQNSGASLEATLRELSLYYAHEAEKIAEQNRQLKGLYTDGLISRVEMEASDKSLLEARAKLEDVEKQLSARAAVVNATVVAESEPLAAVWTTGNKKIDNLIRDHGKLYGVDPYLIYCVISQESGFKSGAISSKGAQGLMQLMPATAARYGVANPFDPAQSIRGGTHYLKDLLDLFDGRVDLALAAYNAGEGSVMKYGNRVPPYAETQSYVRLISKRYTKKNGS